MGRVSTETVVLDFRPISHSNFEKHPPRVLFASDSEAPPDIR